MRSRAMLLTRQAFQLFDDDGTGKIVLSVASGLMMRPLFRPYGSERFQMHLPTGLCLCAVRCLDGILDESTLKWH